MESSSKKVYNEGEKAPGGISIENTLNKDDDALPFGLFNPETEGKLTWICNYGSKSEGDVMPPIVSVFCFDNQGHTERDVRLLADLDEAKYARDELIKSGWRKLIPPKIAFTVTSDNGSSKPLSRKERRYLDRKIRQVARQQGQLQEDSDPSSDS